MRSIGDWVVVLAYSMAGLLATGGEAWCQDVKDAAIIPASEARLHVGKQCTVELTVRSSKNSEHRKVVFLDSEEDFHNERNLAILIGQENLRVFAKAGIDDPATYYRGKVIQVTGKVIRESGQTRIRVTAPKQISVVKDAKEATADRKPGAGDTAQP